MGVSSFVPALVAACAVAVAGCATYREAPFDAAAFGREWRRRVDDPSVPTRHADRVRRASPTTTTADAWSVADGLTLDEAAALALAYNPALRVSRLRAGVTLATAGHAGLWPDPTLGVDAERIVSGAAHPWVVGGTLGLTLPLSGRLEVERRRAAAEHAAQLLRVAEQEWSLVHRVRVAWAEWSTQATRTRLLGELVERLQVINGITDRMADAGAIPRVGARLFRLERDSRRAEHGLATARLEELRLELHALLGLTPDAPVTLVPADDDAPPTDPTAGADRIPGADVVAGNYAIRIARAEYDVAERALDREVRGQYPDLTIGPGFGRDEGDRRALLGVSLPLPLWNRNRRGVAEATAGRDLARVTLETTIELQTSAVTVARVQWAAATRQRRAFQSTIVPAADEQAADAQRLAEMGEIDAVLLLDALVRQCEARAKLLDARFAEVKAHARLAELAGETAPASNAAAVPTTQPEGAR